MHKTRGWTYKSLLSTPSKGQWERVGIKRRAGVVVPLFSLYSKDSTGLGELSDLGLLVDWCCATGLGIIQLLPMNDVGFDFSPYNSLSTFALDPMYLSLEHLQGLDAGAFENELTLLKRNFPIRKRVDYRIKQAKLDLLWRIFKAHKRGPSVQFSQFLHEGEFWLNDYALYKAIKEEHQGMSWEAWEPALKRRDPDALRLFKERHGERLEFHLWLQWQLYEQLKRAKEYAQERGVLLMGDLPFLVSRDSADVWAHQDYFKLDFSSGAPPDAFYAKGQRWGSPPYNWENIESKNFDYLIEKLEYARNFYDIFRIDHVIGLFRLWTIPISEPLENAGLNGTFEPRDEALWEGCGRRLLSIMVEASDMLLCGEDLGMVPRCSYKVLEELGIPGMEIQRWARDWGTTYDFKSPDAYREISIASLTTHDMSLFSAWWQFEAGTIDELLFMKKCLSRGISHEAMRRSLFEDEPLPYGRLRWKKEIDSAEPLLSRLALKIEEARDFIDLYKTSYGERAQFLKFLGVRENGGLSLIIKQALEKVNASASIFSIQLLPDWLSLGETIESNPAEFRINTPGTVSEKNWSVVIPLSLEDMLALPINPAIKAICANSSRI